MAAGNAFGALAPQYQMHVEDALTRKNIAQAMQQRFMQGQQQSFVPGGTGTPIAVKQGGLGTLAEALSGIISGQQIGQADAQIYGARSADQAAGQAELQAFMAEPDRNKAIAQALASSRPDIRAFALEQQKRRQDQVNQFAGVIKDRDATAAGNAIASQSLPTNFIPQPIPKPEILTQGDNTYALIPGANDTLDLKFAQKGVVVQNNAPAKISDAAIAENTAELKAKKDAYDLGREVVNSSQKAITALEEGAKAGGGEGLKQYLRQAVQAFNGKTEGLTETTQLSQALGDAILANARKLAPVTKADIGQLQDILGSVNTDPTALSKALAWNTAHGFKAMTDFNTFLDNQENLLKDIKNPDQADALRTIYAGQRVGRDMPKGLFGPQLFQLETAKHLGNLGYDMAKLQGLPPGFLDSPPKINMSGAFPATTKSTDPGVKPANLTPAEWDELQKLRQMYRK